MKMSYVQAPDPHDERDHHALYYVLTNILVIKFTAQVSCLQCQVDTLNAICSAERAKSLDSDQENEHRTYSTTSFLICLTTTLTTSQSDYLNTGRPKTACSSLIFVR